MPLQTTLLDTLLLPCTYPMIPLTISFFTKKASDAGASVVSLALVYALGIVVSFTGLGMLLSLLLGEQGAQLFASNAWLNLAIGALFVFFGLSFLGLYQLKPPAFLLAGAGRARMAGGYLGVLFMGLTFAVAAFACVGPFVGTLLVLAASGEWYRPILGMGLVSGVIGFVFFLIALFPGFLKKMPQGGGWMVRLEASLGFIELAAAFKFLSNADLVWSTGLLPRNFYLGIWIVIFGALSLYLFGVFRLKHDPEDNTVGGVRRVIAAAFAALVLYLGLGLFGGKSLGELEAFVPPKASSEFDNLGAAEKEARRSGRPIFVDFTAFT